MGLDMFLIPVSMMQEGMDVPARLEIVYLPFLFLINKMSEHEYEREDEWLIEEVYSQWFVFMFDASRIAEILIMF